MSFFSPNASQTTVCGSEAPSSTSTLHDIAWKNCMPQREAEAQELLRTSTNPEFIRLICSYFPFQDPKTCLEILSTRSPTTALDGILKSLRAKSKRILRRTCLEILEILPTAFDGILKFLHAKCNDDPPCSPIPIWDWKWSPPITTDAAKIADAIDLKISSTLYKVPFTELVRAACHRRSDVVKDLLDGVSATSSTLRRRIKEFYGPKDKYELVEKKLRSTDPLSHWAVFWAISGSWSPENQPNPYDALTSIFLPIRVLFANPDLPLMTILKRLQMLEVLYEDQIVGGVNGRRNFERFMSFDFSILKDVSSKPPSSVARLITDRDVDCFRQLSLEDFLSESTRLSEMSSRWTHLANVVKACCIVYNNDLVELLSEVAKNLLSARNYYSALAFISGIRNAGRCPENLSTSWRLINTEGRYKSYMNQWFSDPGLPLIYPHVHEMRKDREREIEILWGYLPLYYRWHALIGDDVNSHEGKEWIEDDAHNQEKYATPDAAEFYAQGDELTLASD